MGVFAPALTHYPVQEQALRALRQSPAAKKLVLIADVCLCEYTSHGHCNNGVPMLARINERRLTGCSAIGYAIEQATIVPPFLSGLYH
jgi:delta-aminolevulinic acid dehydratase/porphobilinogen synthase